MNYKYCPSLTSYSRYKTREVFIGDIPLGAENPIRIQSMTTTDTMNTIATVEQSIRMINVGCEYVRITAPSINEAKNLKEIKNELYKRGFKVPLIADIHFTPNAAELAARIVEKVRINPGNYFDKKKFNVIEYTDKEYQEELEKIRDKFLPLLKICKEFGTAIRIGANHGSLSDRIMSRYGDTPIGMVESAMEFLRICEENNFHKIVISMKSSNTQVMVQAYRLLVQKMNSEKMNYPLHLGVTEAGFGEDGRIKSAIGIGTLLEDGLGDTIRVSLTEDPEFEIPVAKIIASRYEKRKNLIEIKSIVNSPINPFEYKRRNSFEIIGIGNSNVPKVVADFSTFNKIEIKDLEKIGYHYNTKTDKWFIDDSAADFIYLGNSVLKFSPPLSIKIIYDYNCWISLTEKTNCFPLLSINEYLDLPEKNNVKFLSISINDLTEKFLSTVKDDKNVILILNTENIHGMAEQRRIFFELINLGIQNPVIIKRNYKEISLEELTLFSSTDIGALLIDGLGDGIWIQTESSMSSHINRISFNILQAARVRISKTEYIACPSCGRTLFDLQETTEKIRNKTSHLKGVKIAIMGCIVNGPGEMADADFGFVGSGFGKITLYKGKEIVRRNIPSVNAVEELIDLIKENNSWVEPK